ncbi:hypothetical protein L0668_03175 [Paraglaciecola aquimarina]|uniref:Uncharacterized protein n=1 Tax=Paraglaciecola algarum TaxID=3050085 RepID=A0ABS9D4Y7_9ALTE|nr:hypothetical protein [Paraglaciecola sp. G1-23]MCF2947093.1 hypothetical protein [Paraglaciecola sp. G1-23]
MNRWQTILSCRKALFATCLYFIFLIDVLAQSHEISIELLPSHKNSSMVTFGLDKLRSHSSIQASQSPVTSILLVYDESETEQGFLIANDRESLTIKASDNHGFMYGLLEVHEENGVLINSYHNQYNGPARWEWFQDQQKVCIS